MDSEFCALLFCRMGEYIFFIKHYHMLEERVCAMKWTLWKTLLRSVGLHACARTHTDYYLGFYLPLCLLPY
jgi:hypothetical protein